MKLSLYRHFTNTLIFAVIGRRRPLVLIIVRLTALSTSRLYAVAASVIFIIWTAKTLRTSTCQSVSSRWPPSSGLVAPCQRCVCVCVCRTGGSCGSSTPSGASCSPSSCW